MTNKDHLFRVSLKAVIRNAAGELLVVKEKGQTHWNLPGGGMDHDESYHEALARELQEEIGGVASDFTERIVGYHDARVLGRDPTIWQTILVFEVSGVGEQFEPGVEAEAIMFVAPETVAKDRQAYSRVVEEYCKINKQ